MTAPYGNSHLLSTHRYQLLRVGVCHNAIPCTRLYWSSRASNELLKYVLLERGLPTVARMGQVAARAQRLRLGVTGRQTAVHLFGLRR